MSGSRKVAAIVVTYNRSAQLICCLDAILSQEGASCDGVIVLDNGSTDGTELALVPYVTTHGVVHINVGENYGSAGGFHLGVHEALIRGYDLLWIMDDDVVPDRFALKAFVDADAMLGGEWGFLSSVAYWIDGSICKPNVQKKGVFRFVAKRDYERDVVPVRMAAMASLMLRMDVVREVGLPIAEYFFYTDDYEYTCRVSKSHPSYMVTASKVVHCMGKNEKPNLAADTEERMWRYEYLYRNDVNCYRKLGLVGWLYLVAKAGYTTANILFCAKGSRSVKLKILWKSLIAGIAFNPEVKYVAEASKQ